MADFKNRSLTLLLSILQLILFCIKFKHQICADLDYPLGCFLPNITSFFMPNPPQVIGLFFALNL